MVDCWWFVVAFWLIVGCLLIDALFVGCLFVGGWLVGWLVACCGEPDWLLTCLMVVVPGWLEPDDSQNL